MVTTATAMTWMNEKLHRYDKIVFVLGNIQSIIISVDIIHSLLSCILFEAKSLEVDKEMSSVCQNEDL